ncbi:restriction endonuclease subunit S [Clavibacter sp. km1a]|uniref:restriction endonuclease subunit S n=1 Tax=Clavibacter sp. km1a TaxID=3459136 RepID=UPI004042BFE2
MTKVPLGDIADIVSGATPKSNVDEYWGGNVQWVTPADLSRLTGAHISTTPRTLTELGLQSCSAMVLPPGSVLLSSRAPIGHVAINDAPMATNQGFKSLIPRQDRVDAKYLYHWLRANKALLQSLGNGATFKEISKAVVARIEIPLPPLEEQKRIAAILDSADALGAKRRQVLAYFNVLEDAVFNELSLSATSRQSIGSLLSFKSGSFLPAKAQEPGDVPVYGGNGVTGYHSRSLFESSKVVVGRVGAYCGAVHTTAPRSWITDNALYVSEVHADLAMEYLAAALRAANLNQYASQSGQPLISAGRISAVEIPVPTAVQQDAFVNKTRAILRARGRARNMVSAETEMFASMQARAFRGEL